jgi:hypothetical protein
MLLADVIICAVGKMAVLLMNPRIQQQMSIPPPSFPNYNTARFVWDKSISL